MANKVNYQHHEFMESYRRMWLINKIFFIACVMGIIRELKNHEMGHVVIIALIYVMYLIVTKIDRR